MTLQEDAQLQQQELALSPGLAHGDCKDDVGLAQEIQVNRVVS